MRAFYLNSSALVRSPADVGSGSAPAILPDKTHNQPKMVDRTQEMSQIRAEMVAYREDLQRTQAGAESLVSRMTLTVSHYAKRMGEGYMELVNGNMVPHNPVTVSTDDLKKWANSLLEVDSLAVKLGGQSRLSISPRYISTIIATACKAGALVAKGADGFTVAAFTFTRNVPKQVFPDDKGALPEGAVMRTAATWKAIEPFFSGGKDRPDIANTSEELVPVGVEQINTSHAVAFEQAKRDQYGKLVRTAENRVAFQDACLAFAGLIGLSKDMNVIGGNSRAEFETYRLAKSMLHGIYARLEDILTALDHKDSVGWMATELNARAEAKKAEPGKSTPSGSQTIGQKKTGTK